MGPRGASKANELPLYRGDTIMALFISPCEYTTYVDPPLRKRPSRKKRFCETNLAPGRIGEIGKGGPSRCSSTPTTIVNRCDKKVANPERVLQGSRRCATAYRVVRRVGACNPGWRPGAPGLTPGFVVYPLRGSESISDFGFRISDFGFRISDFGLRTTRLEIDDWGLGGTSKGDGRDGWFVTEASLGDVPSPTLCFAKDGTPASDLLHPPPHTLDESPCGADTLGRPEVRGRGDRGKLVVARSGLIGRGRKLGGSLVFSLVGRGRDGHALVRRAGAGAGS